MSNLPPTYEQWTRAKCCALPTAFGLQEEVIQAALEQLEREGYTRNAPITEAGISALRGYFASQEAACLSWFARLENQDRSDDYAEALREALDALCIITKPSNSEGE